MPALFLNIMTKKEFMAMSLPYKLPVISKHGNSIGYLTAISEDTDFIFRTVCVGGREKEMKHIDNTLPILRPRSDLTNQIEHKGDKFIPVDMFSSQFNYMLSHSEMFDLDSDFPFKVVKKLIEWKFDIAGLIDKGEEIDYSTLEGFSF